MAPFAFHIDKQSIIHLQPVDCLVDSATNTTILFINSSNQIDHPHQLFFQWIEINNSQL